MGDFDDDLRPLSRSGQGLNGADYASPENMTGQCGEYANFDRGERPEAGLPDTSAKR